MTIENMASWQEIKASKEGTVFVDVSEGKFRFLIQRGPMSLVAYLGIPLTHALAWRKYESLSLACHGGLTFDSPGDGKYLPSGYYWYGWDYAHAGDAMIFPRELEDDLLLSGGDVLSHFLDLPDFEWHVRAVSENSIPTLEQFRAYVVMAETEDSFWAKLWRILRSSKASLYLWRKSQPYVYRYKRWQLHRSAHRYLQASKP